MIASAFSFVSTRMCRALYSMGMCATWASYSAFTSVSDTGCDFMYFSVAASARICVVSSAMRALTAGVVLQAFLFGRLRRERHVDQLVEHLRLLLGSGFGGRLAGHGLQEDVERLGGDRLCR